MITVEDILSEVHHSADLQNGRVIDLAFRMRNFHCAQCQYPQNAKRFDELLFSYVHLKRRAQILSRGDDYLHTFSTLDRPPGDLNLRLFVARNKLKKIWPCPDCMKRFNPTGRYRRSFRSVGRCAPTLTKGFLDG